MPMPRKSLDRRLHPPPVEANVKVLPYPSARPSDVVADEYYTGCLDKIRILVSNDVKENDIVCLRIISLS